MNICTYENFNFLSFKYDLNKFLYTFSVYIYSYDYSEFRVGD